MKRSITIDECDGITTSHKEIIDPTWNDVESLFKLLDGNIHTLLTVVISDELFMNVGGGPSHFIVAVTNGEDELTLKNDIGDGQELELKAGGQYGNYSISICNEYIGTINTIEYFFKTGGLHPESTWIA